MKKCYLKILFILFITTLLFPNFLFSQWEFRGCLTQHKITDMKFINTGTGFLCTSYEIWPSTGYGEIFRTTNWGFNWTNIFTNNNSNIEKIFFVNATTGFAKFVTFSGNQSINGFYRTTNGGTHWDTLFFNNSPINDFYFLNSYTGWCVGSYYTNGVYSAKIINTTTNWSSWTIKTFGNFTLNLVRFPNANTGYAIGSIIRGDKSSFSNIILKTTDAGDLWDIIDTSFSFQPYGASFVNASTGYICGTGGSIIKTTNGGNKWETVQTGITAFIPSIHFATAERGWFVTNYSYFNYIYYTTNGGLNWSKQFSNNSNYDLNVICFYGPFIGYAGGRYGFVLSTINGGSSYINKISNEITDKYILSQNYPNPFNAETSIDFSIPVQGLVKIKIYNSLGKEIAFILNEKLNKGLYNIRYNSTDLSSGVYFYKIEVNGFSDVKKMVIIK